MPATILLALLGLVGAAIAVPKQSTRIVGGSPTTIQQYPYMANMQYAFSSSYWVQSCGGSLLTTTTVLSACHCYSGDSVNRWRAHLGSSSSTGGIQHTISRFILHPDYRDATLDADVAIVKLAVPATLSATVNVARIPGNNYNLPDGTIVTAIGWGALYSDGPSATQLQHVNVNIINHQLCKERYAYLKSQPQYNRWPDVTAGMVCSGILDVGGKDACQGDSGGPLSYERDIVYGVTSWGYECAHNFYPGVNARVSYYSDWIVANG